MLELEDIRQDVLLEPLLDDADELVELTFVLHRILHRVSAPESPEQ